MSTVEEIKAAIGQLPLEERAALIAGLCGWTDDDWDRRMKADAKAGKFAALNEDAGNAYRGGRTNLCSDFSTANLRGWALIGSELGQFTEDTEVQSECTEELFSTQ